MLVPAPESIPPILKLVSPLRYAVTRAIPLHLLLLMLPLLLPLLLQVLLQAQPLSNVMVSGPSSHKHVPVGIAMLTWEPTIPGVGLPQSSNAGVKTGYPGAVTQTPRPPPMLSLVARPL